MENTKVPKRVQKIVDACKRGQTLCLTLRHSDAGDERHYWFEPSNRKAGVKSAERAIEMGLLVPAGDGLFDLSQTYRAA
jgi:hypothetical protein